MKPRVLFPILLLAINAGCAKGCSDKSSRGEPNRKARTLVLDQEPSIPKKVNIDFDGKVELIGYKAPGGKLKPNQRVKVVFYWRAKEKLKGDWKLLTHLVDGSGDRLLVLDEKGPLRTGSGGKAALQPDSWVPGKVYVDELTFKVPGRVKTDHVKLLAALTSGEIRMPVTSGAKDSENRAIVAELKVTPSGRKMTPVPNVYVEKIEGKAKIKIDGKLDEEAWKTAPVVGPFVDVRTGEPNKTFPVNGKARLLWDDHAFYVGAEIEDPDIVGGFPKDAKDPHLWTKDAFELMIDPDWERKNTDYYEIQIGPQNLVFDTQWDDYNQPLPSPEGPFGHEDWSAQLKSAVVIDGTLDKSDDNDKGYTIEAMIPWKSFTKAKRTPPEIGDNWRMNFYAMQENSGVAWSPIFSKGNFHTSSRFGRVHFVKKGFVPPSPDGSASAAAAPPPPPASAAAPKPAGSAP